MALDEISLLVLDVDGVLTDGSIVLDDHGVETKRFHVRDGTGIRIWQRLGNQVAVITGRTGMALRHRAEELGISLIYDASDAKHRDFTDVLNRLNLAASNAAVVGDDLPDLTIMKLAGYAIAVGDASAEVRSVADFVTSAAGGRGAVREAIEHILKAQDRWDEAVAIFSQTQ
ncbi:MAG TPA: HAD hydrolase family protein [Phycisphaerales bacterium]|nr:HAD hydrolase family protein [Phycisphaerales bacterium]